MINASIKVGKMMTDAALLFAICKQEGMSTDEALEAIRETLGEKYFNKMDGSIRGGERGGETSGQMMTDAASLFATCREGGMSTDEALKATYP